MNCTTCNNGWYVNFTVGNNYSTCETKCGDGILVGSEQCDDGNNVDGDGCNSDCTIGNNNGCPKSEPLVIPGEKICYGVCPIGYFPN
jgi:cysteine-rich repeat protein